MYAHNRITAFKAGDSGAQCLGNGKCRYISAQGFHDTRCQNNHQQTHCYHFVFHLRLPHTPVSTYRASGMEFINNHTILINFTLQSTIHALAD